VCALGQLLDLHLFRCLLFQLVRFLAHGSAPFAHGMAYFLARVLAVLTASTTDQSNIWATSSARRY
jgi:hypothetical protein